MQPLKVGFMGSLNLARWVLLALVFGSSFMGMGSSISVDILPAAPAIGKFANHLETVWSLEKTLVPQEHRLGLDNGLGATPPMGWNSWNHFSCDIDEDVIFETAKALLSTGLADLGYTYVNIDDCWAELERDSEGNLVPRLDTFPSGIKALADHVHSLGLKLGLYTDAGDLTCSKTQPGSLNHEEQDAHLFASWDVDYLKYDNCFNDDSLPELRYPVMRDALNKTGRSTFFSMCEWGENDPALWATNVGNSWRTTGDIKDKWRSMATIADENDKWAGYAGPGGWNDPDMLEVGNGGMSMAEYRTHFSLWALMKAPLLIGCDVRNLSHEVLEILSNKDVIAVNQDPLGVQGRKIVGTPWWWQWWEKREVWAGPLSGGRTVVLLCNKAIKPDTVTLNWEDVLESKNPVIVQDLWNHEIWEANYEDGIQAYLAPHASQMLILTPKGSDLGHRSS